jgi:hypothetical protein
MKWLIALFVVLSGASFWFTRAEPESLLLNAVEQSDTPVIVELFTSEGCSSCPPADRLLTQLAQANASIIPLSEHVDYWNYIGWADPFSSPAFSERQRQYAETFAARGARSDVYTPQMVVDGRLSFVGSNATQAQASIAQAAQSAKAHIEIALTPPTANQSCSLRINITNLPPHETAQLMLAVTENNLASSVTRGENTGRRLPHSAVTRLLQPIAEIEAKAQSFTAATDIKLNDRWQRSSLRFIAFVQERTQRRIIGAATVRLPDK